ncbi:MAG: hypothetical protein JO290_03105 [Sphingomonadaceae bacterium]|nr:hypothetical protein [Sphingomonadaceae bacterium]
MKRRPHLALRLPRWQEASVYGGGAVLLASGVAWLILHDFLTAKGDFGPQPNPAEHPTLIVHGVVAAAFLVVGGAMIPVHVRLGLASGRNRVSGIATGVGLLFLAATGAGLYYVGDEGWRAAVSVVHWGVGLAAAAVLAWHAAAGKRR